MMRVPKSLKKEFNDRPLRPKTGVKSDKKVAHLSWAMFEHEEDEWEERIRLDADEVDGFREAVRASLPKSDAVWCPLVEVWYISKEHKDKVLELVSEHFEVVKKDLRKWKV